MNPEPRRKERRELARAQRLAAEQAARERAARRRRLSRLAGTLGVVVVILVAAIVVSGTGAGTADRGIVHGREVRTTVDEVSSLLAGIPESGSTLGNPEAPVTLEYFGDLECPYCQLFTLESLPTLIESYVRSGKLEIRYRSLETATRDPAVFRPQQMAALAAGRQDRLWYYVELFYREQGEEDSGYVTETYLRGLASQVPALDFSRWQGDRDDPALAAEVAGDEHAALQAGLRSTPSFLLGRTGGPLRALDPSSLTDPSAFTSAIDTLLG
jgi:protein-disulfide isomerase